MKQNLALVLFAIGAFSPNYFPSLPSLWATVFAALSLTFIFLFTRKSWVLAPFFGLVLGLVLGLALGVYQACRFDDQLLSKGLDGQIFQLSATITHSTTRSEKSQRLELLVEHLSEVGGEPHSSRPRKVLLSWYGEEKLEAGNRIVAEVKLRRPRGLQNPGLFDYQKWLYAEGYGATGYVRELIQLDEPQTGISRVGRWRADKAEIILKNEGLLYPGVHQALSLGFGSSIDRDVWSLFVDTGTVHLMVISGLHVGLAAGIGYLLGFSAGRVISPIFNSNAVRTGIIGSILFALMYALTSGFDLPAKRAFIMLLTLLVPRYFYLRVSPWTSLSMALALASIFEPRAVMQVGFWLSFGAVVLIFIGFSGLGRQAFLVGLVRTQALFFVGFSGVLMWQGVPVPTVSFIANLIAVPFVSLLLVPAEMLALMASMFSDNAAQQLWGICDGLVHLLVYILNYMVELGLPSLVRPADWGLVQGVAVVSAFFIWVAPGRYLRVAILACCLPLLFPPDDRDYFLKLRVFDVGQGTSVLVQHQGYSLLYDTGPKFSEYFDSGEHIIAPSLRQLNVKEVDRLIVSHPDLDHQGGLEGVLAELPVKQLDVSKPPELSVIFSNQHYCQRGQTWTQGELVFRYLWPDGMYEYSDNDSSCVLLIEAGDIRILLPGDISAEIERELAADQLLAGQGHFLASEALDVIVVPHHGSKSSSSYSFLRGFLPGIAIVSAGYQNQFNHPHPDVVNRYVELGSQVLNTADSGAIEIRWSSPNSEAEVIRATDSEIFWWQK